MEEVVWKTRAGRSERDKILAALRARWQGKDHPSSHKINIKYLLILDEMSERLDSLDTLVLYIRLHGFSLLEEWLTCTTPPILTLVPHFDIAIPTYFSPQEPEVYRYNRVVSFVPPRPMIVTSEGRSTRVDSRDILVWSPGTTEYKLEGEDRLITVYGELTHLVQPTVTTDVRIPLGVCVAGVVMTKENPLVRIVGNCCVAWEPTSISVLRGAYSERITWEDSKEVDWCQSGGLPLRLNTKDGQKVNWLLLNEVKEWIRFDLVCYRIEDIMWQGRCMIDRPHTPKVDRDRMIEMVEGINRVDTKALLTVPTLAEAEREYKLWDEAGRKWRSTDSP
jgi:hypothetical protein